MGMRYNQENIELDYLEKNIDKSIFISEVLSPVVKYHLYHGKLKHLQNKVNSRIDFQRQTTHKLNKGFANKTKMISCENVDYKKYDMLVLHNRIGVDSQIWLKLKHYYFIKKPTI